MSGRSVIAGIMPGCCFGPRPSWCPSSRKAAAMTIRWFGLSVQQYLMPMIKSGLDVLVLGCTHYPILRPAICQVVGGGVPVIDSAEQCAQDVARRLRATGLSRPSADSEALEPGTLRTFVTDDPSRFKKLASRFLGVPIDLPTWVSPDELYATRPSSAHAGEGIGVISEVVRSFVKEDRAAAFPPNASGNRADLRV